MIALELFHANLHLAMPAARMLHCRLPCFVGLDELHNAALMGLWQAAQRYQPARGTFATFAALRIRGAMLDWLREVDPAPNRRNRSESVRTISLDLALFQIDKSAIRERGCVVGTEIEQREEVQRALRALPRHLALLLSAYYLDGLTWKEAGQRCGLSQSRVSQLMAKFRQRAPEGGVMKVAALSPWFGSKRTLAPMIVAQLGQHRAYVEPFCGSCAVLLAKPACSFEMVNDLHGDLTNLAWVIQHDSLGPALYRRLRRTLLAEDTFKHCKLSLGDCAVADEPAQLNTELGTACAERAYAYFVLCWMGRSGMMGTANHNNNFTVRYTANGGNQAGRFHAAVESIPAWRRRLRSVTILRRDGLDLLERLPDEKDSAIYVDPPYLVKKGRYEHDFEDATHGRLAFILSRFSNARVVVSYYDHERLAELYPSPKWTKLDCSRTKHLAVQGRRGAVAKTAPEVLLLNGPPA